MYKHNSPESKKIGPVYALGGAVVNIKVAENYNHGNNTYTPRDTDKSSWFDVAAFAGVAVSF